MEKTKELGARIQPAVISSSPESDGYDPGTAADKVNRMAGVEDVATYLDNC